MLIRDQNEAPIATWTVFLDSNDNGRLESGETSTQTDAQGKYSFADLPKGNYTVSQVLTLGWSNTFPKVAAQSSNVLTPATVLTTTMPMPSVVGGTDASTENFPWMVGALFKGSEGEKLVQGCGATRNITMGVVGCPLR